MSCCDDGRVESVDDLEAAGWGRLVGAGFVGAGFVGDGEAVHAAGSRSAPAPLRELVDGLGWPGGLHFNLPVREVPDIAANPQLRGDAGTVSAKPHALNPARDDPSPPNASRHPRQPIAEVATAPAPD
jgi:fermentation-respiration switch protein FrsA (DUF1100 family)